MLNIKISTIGVNKTIAYAADELTRYLKHMDAKAVVTTRTYEYYDGSIADAIWLGLSPALEKYLPGVENPELDDGIAIKVKDFSGFITGTNNRSVLIAVYRFLTELGCRFIRPGDDGDIIPTHIPEKCDIDISEAPDYRHRGICIEGAVSREHVYDMIDWIPKVGMNSYFFQFHEPHNFFNRWYSHSGNEYKVPEEFTFEDTVRIHAELVDEITRRSIIHHAAGHGWTCLPLGITGNQWDPENFKIPEEKYKYVALKKGQRKFHHGCPRYTQLCYSDPEVQRIMIDSVIDYIKEHKNVDLLHFWLADSNNNHCECENCVKRIPSDFYVEILNKLDERLTDEKLDTKLVFLIYNELLYAPETEQISNPHRFTLMFAPHRSYSTSYKDIDINHLEPTPPFIRNNIIMPKTPEQAVGFLYGWKRIFKGDGFVFDYHLYADHFKDMGYHKAAKILFEDMQNLDHIGLNGMISCQLTRAFFPTSLPNYAMAKGLWDKHCSFDGVEDEYYAAAFGKKGGEVKEYLTSLSELVPPEFFRDSTAFGMSDEDFCRSALKASELIVGFRETIEKAFSDETDPNIRRSWYYLGFHSHYAENCVLSYYYSYSGNKEKAEEHKNLAIDLVKRNEDNIHRVYDVFKGTSVIKELGKFDDALF